MSRQHFWKSTIAGTALGALLLGGTLVGCASGGLALGPAATATPGAVHTGSVVVGAPVTGQAVTGSGVIVQGSGAPAQPAAGVVYSAPSGVASNAAVVSPPPATAPASSRGITVSGTGEIQARPDEAIVEAGVTTRANTAQDAQAQNNQTMQAVIAAIKGLGIPDKDVQTTGVSLFPLIGEGNTVQGYNASNNVTVTVENVDQAGAVLDAAVKAGANTSSGIRFTFKDETSLRNKALAAAASDARSKASALAQALGLQISGVESVTEGQVNIPRPFIGVRTAAVPAAAQAVPVEPGQQTVTAQVTIVFGY